MSNKFSCRICGHPYPNFVLQESCERSHDTVVLTLWREDLFKLLQFIMTKDESLLSGRLMKSLQNYQSGFYT